MCFIVQHTANILFAMCPCFAVCCFASTRQMVLLPCAVLQAFGKWCYCRVPEKRHTAKVLCPVVKLRTLST